MELERLELTEACLILFSGIPIAAPKRARYQTLNNIMLLKIWPTNDQKADFGSELGQENNAY